MTEDHSELFEAVQAALRAHSARRAEQARFQAAMSEAERVQAVIDAEHAALPPFWRRRPVDVQRMYGRIARRLR